MSRRYLRPCCQKSSQEATIHCSTHSYAQLHFACCMHEDWLRQEAVEALSSLASRGNSEACPSFEESRMWLAFLVFWRPFAPDYQSLLCLCRKSALAPLPRALSPCRYRPWPRLCGALRTLVSLSGLNWSVPMYYTVKLEQTCRPLTVTSVTEIAWGASCLCPEDIALRSQSYDPCQTTQVSGQDPSLAVRREAVAALGDVALRHQLEDD